MSVRILKGGGYAFSSDPMKHVLSDKSNKLMCQRFMCFLLPDCGETTSLRPETWPHGFDTAISGIQIRNARVTKLVPLEF